eukprot:GHVS01050399.1.p1 GENE.GHVS01050399.1~~GHVS01050399.1.p1  ORF type:complete len:237 (+),score=46.92 GHVS01050399.1:60-770(+)
MKLLVYLYQHLLFFLLGLILIFGTEEAAAGGRFSKSGEYSMVDASSKPPANDNSAEGNSELTRSEIMSKPKTTSEEEDTPTTVEDTTAGRDSTETTSDTDSIDAETAAAANQFKKMTISQTTPEEEDTPTTVDAMKPSPAGAPFWNELWSSKEPEDIPAGPGITEPAANNDSTAKGNSAKGNSESTRSESLSKPKTTPEEDDTSRPVEDNTAGPGITEPAANNDSTKMSSGSCGRC